MLREESRGERQEGRDADGGPEEGCLTRGLFIRWAGLCMGLAVHVIEGWREVPEGLLTHCCPCGSSINLIVGSKEAKSQCRIWESSFAQSTHLTKSDIK